MRICRAHAVVAVAAMLAACAADDHRGGGTIDYGGGVYGVRGVGGSGADRLDPWLRDTPEGQRLVLLRFDRNRNGEIGAERAGEANRWFRRFADRNGDLRLTDTEIQRGLRELDRTMRVR